MSLKRLFVMTGDVSGDVHGAKVVRRLKEQVPGIEIQAVGGEALQSAGAEIFHDQKHLGAIGLGVVSAIPSHYKLGKRILKHFKHWRPDAVVVIDYGIFHLWMAKQIRKLGIKVYYYIPPQVWASRRGRIKKIKKAIDHVFCIFPFEEPLYRSYGIPVTFVGHPLAEELPPGSDREAFCLEHGLDPERPIIGLFPGSRKMEIQYLLKPMMESLPLIEQKSGQSYQYVLAMAPNMSEAYFNKYFEPVRSIAESRDFKIIRGQNHAILSLSHACLVASGTVTLEAALYSTPTVISYRGPWLAWQLFKVLMELEHIGLPNLLSGETDRVLPELWMYEVTPENYAKALLPYLEDTPERRRAEAVFERIQNTLGSEPASQKVVNALGWLTGTPFERTPKEKETAPVS